MRDRHLTSYRALAASAVVFACAAAAGAHAGLVPAHLSTEPRIGVAFVVAVFALVASAITLANRPEDRRVAGVAAALFAGLIAAYAMSRTTGIPLLGPDPEELDPVGVATNSIEVLGLICALYLTRTSSSGNRPQPLREVSR